jgi:hypothetical protein
MRFRSKVDTWLVAVALVPTAIVFVLLLVGEPTVLGVRVLGSRRAANRPRFCTPD